MRPRRSPKFEDYGAPRTSRHVAPTIAGPTDQVWELLAPLPLKLLPFCALDPNVLHWRPMAVTCSGLRFTPVVVEHPRVDVKLAPTPLVASTFWLDVARKAIARTVAQRSAADYVERLPDALQELRACIAAGATPIGTPPPTKPAQ